MNKVESGAVNYSGNFEGVKVDEVELKDPLPETVNLMQEEPVKQHKMFVRSVLSYGRQRTFATNVEC